MGDVKVKGLGPGDVEKTVSHGEKRTLGDIVEGLRVRAAGESGCRAVVSLDEIIELDEAIAANIYQPEQRGRLEERERCAKLADVMVKVCHDYGRDDEARAVESLASQIRRAP